MLTRSALALVAVVVNLTLLPRLARAEAAGELERQATTFEASVLALHQRVQRTPQAKLGTLGGELRSASWPRGLPASDVVWVAEKAKVAVDAVKQGLPLDQYMTRAVELLGLSQEGFAAFKQHHFARNDQARIAAVLQAAQDPTGVMGEKGAALVRAIYGAKLWEQYGDRGRARAALLAAQRQARRLGVDLAPLLAVPIRFEGSWRALRLAPGQAGAGKLAAQGDRLPGGHPQWWTGSPQAHLDLVYHKLPALIAQRFEADRRSGEAAPVLRVWHAGFEDASQTFFLAAGVEEAMNRLRRTRPEMREYLDRLKVQITATDHLQRPRREGRRVRFGETEVVHQGKSPLLLAELGKGVGRQAAAEIRELERGLTGEADPRRLDALAKAGKVLQLMGHMLDVRGVSVPGGVAAFDYRIKNRTWQIDDQVNGGRLEGKAGDRRQIRFLKQDITRESPGARHSMDLVVCTNVLHYLKLYGGSNDQHRAGMHQIARALRRGGAVMTDGWYSPASLDKHPAFVRALERGQRQVWVAHPDRLGTLTAAAARAR